MLSRLEGKSFRGAVGSSTVCEGELGWQLQAWEQAAVLWRGVAAVPGELPGVGALSKCLGLGMQWFYPTAPVGDAGLLACTAVLLLGDRPPVGILGWSMT